MPACSRLPVQLLGSASLEKPFQVQPAAGQLRPASLPLPPKLPVTGVKLQSFPLLGWISSPTLGSESGKQVEVQS